MLLLFDLLLSLYTDDEIAIFRNEGETGNFQPPAQTVNRH